MMRAYFTFSEQPSGIYSSQVIDTCKRLSQISGQEIKLIALISIRGFKKAKQNIRSQYPTAIVWPMFPKMKNWRWNVFGLCVLVLFFRIDSVICRSALSTRAMLVLKRWKLIKTVIYDGRGAEYEQMREYKMVSDQRLMNTMLASERIASTASDFQMAVSSSLVNYWRTTFHYQRTTFLVIPCTLNTIHRNIPDTTISRQAIGFNERDIVLVYSGSVSGWQSFKLIFDFVEHSFIKNSAVKLLLLTKRTEEVLQMIEKYPDRVVQVWCEEHKVNSYLRLGDYGLLFRERTVTNQVASPVKFAEYLFAGLQVLISDVLEDFSDFTREHGCGVVYSGQEIELKSTTASERERNQQLVQKYLAKDSQIITDNYRKLLAHC